MKIRLAIFSVAVAVGLAAMTSCGSKHEASSEQAEQQRTELYEAMKSGDIVRVEMIADSLSQYTDDLTTDETVAVLLAYLQVHNDAVSKKDQKHDLITIRKFVDVYDIAGANLGDELVNAFNKAKELNGNLDLQSIAQQFREQLADYDAASGDLNPAPEEPAAKAEEPKAEEPAAETPKADAPKAEQPKQEVQPIED